MPLAPTCFQIPKGHRLRLVLSSADFPRLWPETEPAQSVLELSDVRLTLPVVADATGVSADDPTPPAAEDFLAELMVGGSGGWVLSRDHVNDTITMTLSERSQAYTLDRMHLLDIGMERSASVARAVPSSAVVRGTGMASSTMSTGETVEIRVELELTETAVSAYGPVSVDGKEMHARRWVG